MAQSKIPVGGHLKQDDAWFYGPDFEVVVRFRETTLRALTRDAARQTLDRLEIVGPWRQACDIGDADRAIMQWNHLDCAYGLWPLGRFGIAGVRLSSEPWCPDDLLCGVPGDEMRRVLGTWPWTDSDPIASIPFLDIHRMVIGRVRSLHRTLPIRAAILRDQLQAHSLLSDAEGILVDRRVAEAGRLEGKSLRRMVRLGLEG